MTGLEAVVVDSSPLNYLVQIGAIEALPKLFRKVLVPPAVVHELSHPRSPIAVSTWAKTPPTWVEIRSPRERVSVLLGAGEVEAISLTLEVSGAALLLDDQQAREQAEMLGISVFGTLAYLQLGDQLGFLDGLILIGRLRETSFRAAKSLWESQTERMRSRRALGGEG